VQPNDQPREITAVLSESLLRISEYRVSGVVEYTGRGDRRIRSFVECQKFIDRVVIRRAPKLLGDRFYRDPRIEAVRPIRIAIGALDGNRLR
jgi:hypothetical protein